MAKEKQQSTEKVEKKGKKEAPHQPAAAEPVSRKHQTPRLKTRFKNEILPAMLKDGYKNPMAVPRLTKIVVNMGVGEAIRNIKVLDQAADEVGRITGQKPVIRRAKKAISSFKLRAGMPIGVSVTLRGDQMF